MKLKNKKTGETGYYLHTHRDHKTGILKVAVLKDGVPFSEFKPYEPIYDYDSLAELNEEWCDYEEPKEYWYITAWGSIESSGDMDSSLVECKKEIGNYFDTREEAEKAVEKLKAWKRLKDGGITFKNWTINQTGTIDCFATWGDNIPPSRKNPTLLEDLDLLFCSEENI